MYSTLERNTIEWFIYFFLLLYPGTDAPNCDVMKFHELIFSLYLLIIFYYHFYFISLFIILIISILL